ncbi:MAG: 3-phosphoshikimate 1-carboxyvinyltransferase [Thermoplasmata archaeon]|jgi:3-phosphoshikimate 1-carboxyvinyltransferase|nr:3-phosphoshikimate 1-carboxyvinyltransferase [Thermoplasmata archaeon]
MTVRTVYPSRAKGRVAGPPSKSYTHRAIVAAFLSAHRFSVEHPLDSDDTRATATAVGRLGVAVSRSRERWTFHPRRRPRLGRPIEVDCGESGTTLRFVTVLAALGARRVRFLGSGRLGSRPMAPLLNALRALGAEVRAEPTGFPFILRGPIHGGRVRLDASESSQFASALLLALPTRAEDSRILLDGEIVSEPYVEATLATLRRLRVHVTRRGREFRIAGGQAIHGNRFRVPGDASSAAYLWVAGAIAGGPVTVTGVSPEWPQADRKVLELLRQAGGEVRESAQSVTVRTGSPCPFSMDFTSCPDLYPLAGVLAATLPGRSRLRGAAHVVHKESNRRTETARLARAFGARVEVVASGLVIEGRGPPRAVDLRTLADHRLVMSAAVGALAATGPSRIGVAESVRKSFPGFWTALRDLGTEVSGP